MPDAMAGVLQSMTDSGARAARADRSTGSRSRPPLRASVASDSATERRVATAWWNGYYAEWPEALAALDDIDTTGVSDADLAADAEPV
jgi:hypothetical protein